jgi:galactokinase
VRAFSASQSQGEGALSYELGAEAAGRGWLDYVQGVTAMLRAAGRHTDGFDLYIESDVPAGAGLASSAALEVALLRGLDRAFALTLDGVAIALLGRRVETDFVGVPVGIMDQMASSLADARSALLLDTRTLEWRSVPLPAGIAFLVIGSGIAHSHVHGDYRTRRAESIAAAQALGVGELRDATLESLGECKALPETLARRARHIVRENARVLLAVAALEQGDAARLGRLFSESHASLRDDYEVSIPEIDELVQIAEGCTGVHGARITGGGFGGSVVAVVDSVSARTAGQCVTDAYARRTGRTATLLILRQDEPGA